VRKITKIVVHCSATPEGRVVTAKDIDRMHRERGFAGIGYHWFIRLDGTVEPGRAEAIPGAHASGHNFDSIAICYAGGLAKDGKTAKDTRTAEQKAALLAKVKELRGRYPNAKVKGHRDLSPDTNKNGKVDKWEWVKSCPSFDVAAWLKEVGL
jgi:N-acetylmuramoyl-L-alanine amidase